MRKGYKKFALIGTSCVGKTTILKEISQSLNGKYKNQSVVVVPEAARVYFRINKTNRPFSYSSQKNVQQLAQELEKIAIEMNPKVILTDRSVLDAVAYVWSTGDKRGASKLLNRAKKWLHTYDYLFLLDPWGVTYSKDDVRKESLKTRESFHKAFLEVLPKISAKWTLIGGPKKQRVQAILQLMNSTV